MGVNLAERSRRRDLRFGMMLIAPAVLIIVMLLGYPMGYAVFMSLHEWNDKLGMEHPFIGLQNYGQLMTDPAVHRAMERTAYFSVITVIGGVALAVAIAVLLNREFRGRTLARVLLLVPWAVPPVVNGIMWKLIFDGSTGIANTVLRSLGLIDENVQWLSDPALAMNILVFAEMWKLLPFLCLLMLAALQGIPSNLYRAAAIDGAGPWRAFWRITLPNMRGALMFALIVQSMWSLKVFDTIYVLTGGSGGPAEGTTTINFLAYLVNFSNLDRGYGSAMAVGIMILVLVVAVFWILLFGGFRRKRRESHA
ncbi:MULTISPECIES: carbohydrate ABC transporter permease [unclassified Microbacterium]|uniref:carbohydrate ABC transporter permease n=1 Tax=unclassified Microbacterium TaxID=2609290 RepID=UPI0016055006|nr:MULTISPECIES: sugar ABC transporter permease [unclassified Microbacterium]QNA91599.1 sugar ABC transporter permease [Microbacterium sp. Se63.02b]QYM64777.1 sugar ABC transporter permease [Microbacterium sp. Se5.02b]